MKRVGADTNRPIRFVRSNGGQKEKATGYALRGPSGSLAGRSFGLANPGQRVSLDLTLPSGPILKGLSG